MDPFANGPVGECGCGSFMDNASQLHGVQNDETAVAMDKETNTRGRSLGPESLRCDQRRAASIKH